MGSGRDVSCGEALSAFGVVALCVAFALHYPDGSAEWAAWIQAFGSVAAIVGAGWIARGQLREAQRVEEERRSAQQRAEADARKEQLRAVAVFVDQLFRTLDTTANALLNEVSTSEMARYASARIAPVRVAVEALANIPLHHLPNAYIGVPVLNLKNIGGHILGLLERIAGGLPAAHAEAGPGILVSVAKVGEYRDRALDYLEAVWAHTDEYDGVKSPVILARDLRAPD